MYTDSFVGPTIIIQDVLHVADDFRIPRYVAEHLRGSFASNTVLAGAAIMIMSLVLFENEFLNIVAISFTALILNELIMVALEITTW